MQVAGVFEAKQRFSELVAAVEAGEEVRITRHGKEVVRMLPVQAPDASNPTQAERLLARVRAFRAEVKPGPGWRELRDEGRRF
jgi:prevent-host-death family protein